MGAEFETNCQHGSIQSFLMLLFFFDPSMVGLWLQMVVRACSELAGNPYP